MPKLATSMIILAFLLFSLIPQHASARPLQGTLPHKEVHQGDEKAVDAAEDGCDGISEYECLMRRSLAAHLDYIYTQKNNNP
uniref:Phytosulfokine n=1 Tax=Kalanchoe fedtschenkoi TaxID=63787 RepID=A0A7N1A6K3_KALFE